MTDDRTTAYLLNELTEREAEQFEEQCFAQPDWPDAELESAEDDLIQAYIKNELSPEQRRRFEKYYLTTAARKERVLLARSFLRVACSAVEPPVVTWRQRLGDFLRPPAYTPRHVIPRFAGILFVLGLAVIITWLAFRTREPQTFAYLSLAISSETRGVGNQPPKVTLPLAKDALRISLTLPKGEPQGATYRVQWEEVKRPVADLEVKQEDADSIFVIIPAEELKPGRYTLMLFRKDPNGTEQRVPGNYLFNVE